MNATGQNKVYDGSTVAGVTLASSGVLAGDTVSFTDSAANFATANAGNAIPISVTGIGAAGADAGNYNFVTTASTSANIAPAVLNLTGSRTYDGSTGAAARLFGSGGVLTGVAGQTLTLGGTGTLSTKNVGSQQPFAANGVAGFTLSGNGTALASNYTLAGGTDWVTITPAVLNVVGTTTTNRTYDGTVLDTLSGSSLAGLFGQDAVTLGNATVGTFSNKNVGVDKTVTTAMTISGADAGNYVLAQPSGLSASVNPLAIQVNATGTNKVYDANTLDTVTLASTGVLPGDQVTFSSAAANFSDKNVGTGKSVLVSGIGDSGSDAGNYVLLNNTANTTANITPRPIVVNATGTNKGLRRQRRRRRLAEQPGRAAGRSTAVRLRLGELRGSERRQQQAGDRAGHLRQRRGCRNYQFNSSAMTTADITAAKTSGPSLPGPGPAFGLASFQPYRGALAQIQAVLGPQPIPTPYGVANQTATGLFFGNPEPENKSMQRNRIPADFRPGLGLTVINGGVTLPWMQGFESRVPPHRPAPAARTPLPVARAAAVARPAAPGRDRRRAGPGAAAQRRPDPAGGAAADFADPAAVGPRSHDPAPGQRARRRQRRPFRSGRSRSAATPCCPRTCCTRSWLPAKARTSASTTSTPWPTASRRPTTRKAIRWTVPMCRPRRCTTAWSASRCWKPASATSCCTTTAPSPIARCRPRWRRCSPARTSATVRSNAACSCFRTFRARS